MQNSHVNNAAKRAPARASSPQPTNAQPTELEILTVAEAARTLRLSVRTLSRLAEVGEGPRFLQLSERRIGFLKPDLVAWAESRARSKSAA
jgi:predicted DNA-binding transcriptional regulator AlpA